MLYNPCNAAGFRLLLALAVLLVTWQALTSSPAVPPSLGDKALHALVFVGLAFLTDSGWPHRLFDWRQLGWLTLYGALLEALQYLVPGRTASLADLAADVAGLVVYWLVLGPLLRRWFGAEPTSPTPQP